MWTNKKKQNAISIGENKHGKFFFCEKEIRVNRHATLSYSQPMRHSYSWFECFSCSVLYRLLIFLIARIRQLIHTRTSRSFKNEIESYFYNFSKSVIDTSIAYLQVMNSFNETKIKCNLCVFDRITFSQRHKNKQQHKKKNGKTKHENKCKPNRFNLRQPERNLTF